MMLRAPGPIPPTVFPLEVSIATPLFRLGTGAVPAAFAALLSPQVTRVTLKHPPASYAEIAESPEYNWPLSAMTPGVLTRFDLPDCYRVLKARDLTLIEPLDARGRA